MTAAPETRPAGRPPVLVARGLDLAPPGVDVPVMRGVSLEVAAGEWLAVTGENGAGKSTLALTLAGLWPARAGTIEIAGPRGAPRVVTLLQEPATQITQRTVRDEIAFVSINLGVPEEAAWRAAAGWAAKFGLEEVFERAPAELSAGEQQRVLLAGALAANPALLIADEAAAHLDPRARGMALAVLREQVSAGLALIWVTQDLDDLPRADRVFDVEVFREDVRPGPRIGEGPVVAEGPRAAVHGSGPVRVRLRLAPGGPGARIRTAAPREIEIGSRGVWAVTGPNGSGKSSLLDAIAGIDTPHGVDVGWSGVPEPPPIHAGQYPERQIFEERVEDELCFAAVHRGVAREAARALAEDLLVQLGLGPGVLRRRTWSLSAGEKRLVAVVAALIAPAALVVLDEPTCGLDAHRRRVLGSLVRVRAAAVPVVVASQDSSWIREVGAIEVPLGK